MKLKPKLPPLAILIKELEKKGYRGFVVKDKPTKDICIHPLIRGINNNISHNQ
jgi:hypothetical protein